ncbi:MAG: NAD(P)-dependent oxidoreductase [Lachnospiraceae bacterium]|nr:NAD(P)-dependent oxidoreductase [Lachnospiraceae bacterium]
MEDKKAGIEYPLRSVIITGPTGSIGTALIRLCIENNVRVVAVVRPDSGRIANIPSDPLVQVVRLGLEQISKLPDMQGVSGDVFIHLGWAGTFGDSRNDTATQYANIGYSLLAVQAAHILRCHTFIGAGSQAEYGRAEGTLKPDTPVNPENGYGIAKLCAGQMTRLLCAQLGIRHIWTRILSVYGPCDGEGTLISSLLRCFQEGSVLETTKGEQIWDYLYSEDAARAIFLLAEKGLDQKTYCIGSGQGRALKSYMTEAAEAAQKIVNAGSNEKDYVNCIEFGKRSYAPNQVMHLVADISELSKDTGFEPAVNFDEGIQKTLQWMQEIG